METYYLVDYENVGSSGLIGCNKLGKTDHIHIFFTDNCKKIDMDIIHDHGEAEFKTYKVPVGDQSIDMHLVSFLGYLVGVVKNQACNFVIISNDKDYEGVIEFWKQQIKAQNKAVKFAQKPGLTRNSSGNSAGNVKAQTSVKITGNKKQKLNNEVMQKLSEEGYTREIIGEVAHMVNVRLGEERFLAAVHNDLRENYGDYLDTYNIIKPILQKYTETISGGRDNIPEKTRLNNEIQQILSKAGKDGKLITEVASVVAKNAGIKNGKQQIYRTIVSKFGQKEGLELYNLIKKSL